MLARGRGWGWSSLPFKGAERGFCRALLSRPRSRSGLPAGPWTGRGGDGAPSPSRGGLGWGWVFILTAETHPDIVDFVCFQARLIIEVDGGQHPGLRIGSDTRRLAGRARLSALAFLGFTSFD
ncbi:DUF559 domain-containing protein [Pelomicrobium sp. G1]|uniref:DUF559 domain-containing protein n=1 Tax=unclassified Pelomicrobium TaxID=2815318 RepID=UPI003F75F17A